MLPLKAAQAAMSRLQLLLQRRHASFQLGDVQLGMRQPAFCGRQRPARMISIMSHTNVQRLLGRG